MNIKYLYYQAFYLIILSLFLRPGILTAQGWNFEAFLDGEKIGTHSFKLDENAGFKKLESKADFKVKFLFITAYSYKHRSDESWHKNCLKEINSSTEEKGDRIFVKGVQSESAFKIETGKEEKILPACIMTFAYWNPEMLNQTKLLNPQTGDWLDVDIASTEKEIINVKGVMVQAQKYKLTATKMQIDLWYEIDPNTQLKQWLALKSTTPEGYVIEYRLI